MRLPLTVAFHGIPPSEWIEADIRKRAAKLDLYCRNIMSCRVVVDLPHRHHEEGNRFSLRIELTVRGREIVVSHEANLHASRQDLNEREWAKQFEVEGMRKDLQLVIRETFDVARRRLQDHVRRNRHGVHPKTGRQRAAVRRSRSAAQVS